MSQRQVLQVFEQYQKARTQFVQTVAELASRPQNIETLQNAGVMSLLRPLLLDIVPTIQQTAALALGRLANYNDDLAEAVVKGDILPQLVYSLAEQNRFYKKAAAFVLRAVAKHSPQLAQSVVDCGALDALVICLEEFDPGVKEAAAWALGYIARHNAELAQAVVDAGAVPLLVLCIQEPELSLKRIAASALSDICKHSPELAQTVVDAGAIAHLAQMILNPDAKLKRQVFSALSQISKHSVDLAEMVVEAEIFPAVLTCLKDPDEYVKRQDFGVKGVQVEEIYDLQKSFEGMTYGFIFLFRWIEERRSRRKTITEEESFVTDDEKVNSIFFAQQMIPNSCATHALLSVLLNCEKVNLGETLSELKSYSKHMNPENKGYAIGNIPELARAHNSHGRKENNHLPEKQQGMTVRTMEAFHFVSYVPIHGHLFELDGLKPYPIDHGPWDNTEDWTEKFRRVISERLGMATGGEPYHDIRFNLMAVVPDKVSLYEHKLSTLKTNRQIVLEALQQMVKVTNPNITTAEKEKCLAVVQKHGPVTSSFTVPMETDDNNTVKENNAGQRIDRNFTYGIKTEIIDLTDNDSGVNIDNDNGVNIEEIDSKQIQQSLSSVSMVGDVKTENVKSELTNAAEVLNKDSLVDTMKDSLKVGMEVQISSSYIDKSSHIIPTTSSSSTDVTKPLSIETKFVTSPGPSSESTDTASEVGSCFSSPSSSTLGTSAQNSPNVSISEKNPDGSPAVRHEGESTPSGKSNTKFRSQQGFRPKDLIALLKNVENEIHLCENKLADEQEKIKKYKIDNCRRMHNYDQFLCTFLSMLAEQGHLAELVQQHSFTKKRVPGHIGKKLSKLSQAAKKTRTKAKRRR